MSVGVNVGVSVGVRVGVDVGAGIVVGLDMAVRVVHYSTSTHDKWEIEDDNRIPESHGIPGIGGN